MRDKKARKIARKAAKRARRAIEIARDLESAAVPPPARTTIDPLPDAEAPALPAPPGGAVGFEQQQEEVSVASAVATDLGGPCVTVEVPASGQVAVFAEVEISGGGESVFYAEPGLFQPSDFAPARLVAAASGGYETRWTQAGDAGGLGTDERADSGWLVFETVPGPRTFSLRYASSNGGAAFRNRSLWVMPLA